MNVIASQRSLGYANHLKKFGYDPTVVTFQWDRDIEAQYCDKVNFEKEIQMESNEFFKVIKLPIYRSKRVNLLRKIENSFLKRFGVITSWLAGHLDTSSRLLSYKLSEKYFLKDHLRSNSYDFVIGVFSPHFNLANCSWVGKKFKIKYILDFRDLWDNRIIKKDYKPTRTEKVQDFIYSFYWKLWLRDSCLFSITSEPWLNELEKLSNRKGVIITNGFESSDFSVTSAVNEKFTIVHNGSLYEHQDLTPFLKGVSLFIQEVESPRIKISFIGAKRNENSENSYNRFLKNPNKIISSYINSEYFELVPRMSRLDSIKRLQKADLLYFPSFPTAPGTYSGKIFEYLGCRKNILVVPKDNCVVDEIVGLTASGQSMNTENEVFNFLKIKYEEWNSKGVCEYSGIDYEIDNFSRSSQTKKLIKALSQ